MYFSSLRLLILIVKRIVSIMVFNVLTPCVSRPSAGVVLARSDERVHVVREEGLKLAKPSQFENLLKMSTSVYLKGIQSG